MARLCASAVNLALSGRRANVGRSLASTVETIPSLERLEALGYVVPDPFPRELELVRESRYDVSFVIPVYNAEETLFRCVDSLVGQETGHSVQLVLVDDGSSDASPQILDAYAADNSDVVVVHQANSGISASRNRELEVAEGVYVGFVDNDDAVDPDYVETLLDAALSGGYDYVKCGHVRHGNDGDERLIVNEPTDDISHLWNNVSAYNGFIWGGISRRDLWRGLSFPLGCWYEDMITKSLVYRRCDSFCYLNAALYHKYETGFNASNVLWRKGDSKCLDQAVLPWLLVRKGRELGLPDDETLLRVLVSEYGPMLVARVREDLLRTALEIASSTVIGVARNLAGRSVLMTDAEASVLGALVARDACAWRMAAGALRFQRASGGEWPLKEARL
jgi:hypothetical protein